MIVTEIIADIVDKCPDYVQQCHGELVEQISTFAGIAAEGEWTLENFGDIVEAVQFETRMSQIIMEIDNFIAAIDHHMRSDF